MSAAKDNESGYSMNYAYNAQGRISSFTEKSGSTSGVTIYVKGTADGLQGYSYPGADRAITNTAFYGAGAGSLPTASAVVADIIDICRCLGNQPEQQQWTKSENVTSEMTAEMASDYAKRVGTPLC